MKKSLSLRLLPFLLVLFEIATYLSNDMYLPALPAMMHDLHLTMPQVQSTLTIWFLGAAFMPLFMGAFADRFGRKPVLITGGITYFFANVICAFASTLPILLVTRFIQGGMVAAMLVPGYATIHDLYEEKEAIKILALMGSISILAPALGPVLGSIILLFASWRWIFGIIALLTLISVALLAYYMPETLLPENKHPLILKNLYQQYKKILLTKRFILNICVIGFIFAGFIVWITASPLLIINNFQYSALAFGIIQAIVFCSYIIGNRQVKYLLDTLGTNALIYLGMIITALGGLAILIFALLFSTSLFLFIIGMLIYSFGSALCYAPLNRRIIESSDAPMGARVALFTAFITGFSSLGSGTASLFFDNNILSLALLISGAILISYLFFMQAKNLHSQ